MSGHKSERRVSFLVRFGYIGSHFHGLQPHPDLPTAGGALKTLITDASCGVPPKALQFSARTDAGVHALENYATFWYPKQGFDEARFFKQFAQASLSPLLYAELTKVDYRVHARANAQDKWYRYVIEDNSSDEGGFSWNVVPVLDVAAMQEAAAHLVGTHAFDAFRHGPKGPGSSTKSITTIKVRAVALSPTRRQIHIDIEGSGFLRRMVRIIVGTLAEVGAGLRAPAQMPEILASQRRDFAGPSAPALGLTLMRIGFKLV